MFVDFEEQQQQQNSLKSNPRSTNKKILNAFWSDENACDASLSTKFTYLPAHNFRIYYPIVCAILHNLNYYSITSFSISANVTQSCIKYHYKIYRVIL